MATNKFQSLRLAVELLTSSMSAGWIGKPVTMQVGFSLVNKPSYNVFLLDSLGGKRCSMVESVTIERTHVRTSSRSSYGEIGDDKIYVVFIQKYYIHTATYLMH